MMEEEESGISHSRSRLVRVVKLFLDCGGIYGTHRCLRRCVWFGLLWRHKLLHEPRLQSQLPALSPTLTAIVGLYSKSTVASDGVRMTSKSQGSEIHHI